MAALTWPASVAELGFVRRSGSTHIFACQFSINSIHPCPFNFQITLNTQIFMKKPPLVFAVTIGVLQLCLSSCVDFDAASSSNQPIKLSPKERVWIAFLECHSKATEDWVMLSGSFPNVVVSQTPQEKAIEMKQNPVPWDQAEGIVMSSGDADLIKLHEKLKASENAITHSPAYAQYVDADLQNMTADRAYTAPHVTASGLTQEEALGTYDQAQIG